MSERSETEKRVRKEIALENFIGTVAKVTAILLFKLWNKKWKQHRE